MNRTEEKKYEQLLVIGMGVSLLVGLGLGLAINYNGANPEQERPVVLIQTGLPVPEQGPKAHVPSVLYNTP